MKWKDFNIETPEDSSHVIIAFGQCVTHAWVTKKRTKCIFYETERDWPARKFPTNFKPAYWMYFPDSPKELKLKNDIKNEI